jgi:hypothetical protein
LSSAKQPLTCMFSCGRYWVRTSDLFGVNEARYHCANRPASVRRKTIAQEPSGASQDCKPVDWLWGDFDYSAGFGPVIRG